MNVGLVIQFEIGFSPRPLRFKQLSNNMECRIIMQRRDVIAELERGTFSRGHPYCKSLHSLERGMKTINNLLIFFGGKARES